MGCTLRLVYSVFPLHDMHYGGATSVVSHICTLKQLEVYLLKLYGGTAITLLRRIQLWFLSIQQSYNHEVQK
jgi:hypothetical protein